MDREQMFNELKDIRKYVQKALEEMKPLTRECQVKILADSINPFNHKRLTTFELTFWRPILPQLNRHRSLSQSIRSSRATPVDTLITEISNSPWGPKEWGLNESGMVATKVMTLPEQIKSCDYIWYHAAKSNCTIAKSLADAGVHKQIVNRLLEPFSCSHAVVSATEWDNFYKLRTAKDTQPEFREMALKMKELQENSEPKELEENQWHLPYISEEELHTYRYSKLCKISAARCARVSYKTYSGDIDVEKDLQLYQKLVSQGHWSALEHCACPAVEQYLPSNFIGWNQLRKFEEEEFD